MNAIAFQIKLDSDTIHFDNIDSFIGKDVMVTIVEMPLEEETPKKREWTSLGTATFSQNLDDLNIRDLAYE